MGEVKHTTGGWARNIKPATKYNCIYAGQNTHVAYLATDLPPDEVEANCALIVAAPGMLAALLRAEAALDYVHRGSDDFRIAQDLDAIRAAIAAAEGR